MNHPLFGWFYSGIACFLIQDCRSVIMKYVIWERKLSFDQEIKINKSAVSGVFCCSFRIEYRIWNF